MGKMLCKNGILISTHVSHGAPTFEISIVFRKNGVFRIKLISNARAVRDRCAPKIKIFVGIIFAIEDAPKRIFDNS